MRILAAGDAATAAAVYDKINGAEVLSKGKGKRAKAYVNLVTAFDIETTLLPGTKQSIMYHWQWCFDDLVITGRTWDEYAKFTFKVIRFCPADTWLVVYVHNLSFEFQYLAGVWDFNKDSVFALDSRKVAKAELQPLEFRCSYLHSNMDLDTFCTKMGAEHGKLHGYDYSKIRYPDTPMTQEEINYCVNDVLGLCEALKIEMQHDGDDLRTIPLTSTGYVRRDVRKAVSDFTYKKLRYILPDYDTYLLLRRAFRGGNTHANRFYAGRILYNVKSCDRSSSYPDVIVNRLFPMSKFTVAALQTVEYLEKLITEYHKACVFYVTFKDLCLQRIDITVPYLSRDKCTITGKSSIDNGRILHAEECETALTDIDWKIVKQQYMWSGIEIKGLRHAKYGKLPEGIIKCTLDYYHKKTELKGVAGEELLYMKSKNKLNSIYGMMATDPIRDTWDFLPDTDEQFRLAGNDFRQLLQESNKRAFLAYQWGVWTTAHARAALQAGIDAAGEQFVYCDTDSVKYLGDIDLSAFNGKCYRDDIESGAYADDPKGHTHYMGIYEEEEPYDRFITLGAKKYAYEQNGHIGITLAGVPKAGAAELANKGGLEAFKDGFVFEESGKLEVFYTDVRSEYTRQEDGKKFEVIRNVSLIPTTYEIGIAGDYKRIIHNPYFLDIVIRELQLIKESNNSVTNAEKL